MGSTSRFTWARKIVVLTLGLSTLTATTYQAFLKLLRARTVVLAAASAGALRRRMREDLADQSLVGGFVVFGVDGRRRELPRTQSDQGRFAAGPKRSAMPKRCRGRRRAARAAAAAPKKADGPQPWLTLMWHVGTGLPWDWRTGPSDSSDRDHLQQMVAALPSGAVVTADAGSVGYAYRKALLDRGRHLLIRVGANVRSLKGLGYARERAGFGLPVAGPGGGATPAAAGAAVGRGPGPAAPGLPGHVGAG